MNKFMRRGLVMVAVGVGLNLVGYSIKGNELENYGWAMIIGTIVFGIGFLFIFYSFVRKVEYKGIIEERAVVAEKKEQREAGESDNDDDAEALQTQS